MKKTFLLVFLVLFFWPLTAEETDVPAVPSASATAPVSATQPALPAAEQATASSAASPEVPPPAPQETAPLSKTREEQHLDTLRFGTETEIASLIQTLKNEKISYLDNELISIAEKTRNRLILSGIFGFFGETEKKGLEARAVRVIRERDEEGNDTVTAAIDYLGKVKAGEAVDSLEELIDSGESRFLNIALRALGRAGKAEGAPELADSTAAFLLDYYEKRSPSDDNKREIIVALGETGSKISSAFLSDLIKDTDERAVLRMAALDAVSKIADETCLDAVVEAVASTDPNVRASAVAALGPFSGEAAENAVIEAFRDSYYRTRIGAAAAAGKRRLESAVPYLRYRSENDDVPAVKDEAIKALGAINNAETKTILAALFSERKNPDRVRIAAAEMLLQNDAENYGAKVFTEMEEAKNKKLTALYNGFVRVMVPAKSPSLEGIARRFIAAGGVIERSLALDLILNNEFRGLETEIRSLLDEKTSSASIARKAKSTLERLGLNAEPAAPAETAPATPPS